MTSKDPWINKFGISAEQDINILKGRAESNVKWTNINIDQAQQKLKEIKQKEKEKKQQIQQEKKEKIEQAIKPLKEEVAQQKKKCKEEVQSKEFKVKRKKKEISETAEHALKLLKIQTKHDSIQAKKTISLLQAKENKLKKQQQREQKIQDHQQKKDNMTDEERQNYKHYKLGLRLGYIQ